MGFFKSAKLHMMTSVLEALSTAGYGNGDGAGLVFPFVPVDKRPLPHDADNTISRQGPAYTQPTLPTNR